MQKLGQHFLKNASVTKKIIDALELRSGDAVIEIGSGHGELTIPLSVACVAAGASLAAIEKDARLAEALRGKLSDVAITQGDALQVLPQTLAVKKYKLVGNLPYYITGKLLRLISELESGGKPERCIFMVQQEVAERIVAMPPDMNRLAASVQFWADAEIITHVSKSDFSPPPKIDSAVISLKEKSAPQKEGGRIIEAEIDPALYYRAVRGIFAQPRKTILNNFAAILKNEIASASAEPSKGEIAARLQEIGIDPEGRPQNLSIQQIIAAARIL